MHSQPIGLSSDLAPRQVMRTRLGHYDLAVWRSANGVVSAWENRCPHRGMRLSHGFVRGESLACAYHGWHFSCQGQCHYIPAHPELTPPATITPVIHSIVEQSGLLWVSTEGEAVPVDLPAALAPVRSLHCNCAAEALVAAFFKLPPVVGTAAPNITTLSENPYILMLDLDAVADGVVVALHCPEAGQVVAHILAPEATGTEQRISLSRWFEAGRRVAEESVCLS